MIETWTAPLLSVDNMIHIGKEEYREALKRVRPGDHRSCSVCAYWSGYIAALETYKSTCST